MRVFFFNLWEYFFWKIIFQLHYRALDTLNVFSVWPSF